MTDPWRTALGDQARQIHAETMSVERTAHELVRRGASDEEIRDLFYPLLKAQERRLLDRALEFSRRDLFGKAASARGANTAAANASRSMKAEGKARQARDLRRVEGLTSALERSAGTGWHVHPAQPGHSHDGPRYHQHEPSP